VITVQELIKTLNRYAPLIEQLFEQRSRASLRSELSYEYTSADLSILHESGLLELTDDTIELEEALITFLEAQLSANDGTTLLDYDNMLEQLERSIEQYTQTDSFDGKQRLYNRIRKLLRSFPRNLSGNVYAIYRHVEFTYKIAMQANDKLRELSHYKNQLDILQKAERRFENFFRKHQHGFFRHEILNSDRRFYQRSLMGLRDLRAMMMNLNNQVIEYINRISSNTHFFEHLVRLQELKSRHEIKDRTNIMALLSSSRSPLFLAKDTNETHNLDMKFCYSIEFDEMVGQIKAYTNTKTVIKPAAEPVSKQALDLEPVAIVDVEALYQAFLESDSDLMGFIADFSFTVTLTAEERVSLFVDLTISNLHELYVDSEHSYDYEGFRCLIVKKETHHDIA
jgi:hypothetical protein